MTNRITRYKGRQIDYYSPVYVYRNLNSKKLSYSIRQKGLVVAHSDALTLRDAQFIVSDKGRKRVQKEKRKNVHAFIKAYVAMNGVMGTDAVSTEKPSERLPLPARIKYNPYNDLGFHCDNLTKKPFEVRTAFGVIINSKGVFATYVEE